MLCTCTDINTDFDRKSLDLSRTLLKSLVVSFTIGSFKLKCNNKNQKHCTEK